MPPRRRPRAAPARRKPRLVAPPDDAPVEELAAAIKHLHGVDATFLEAIEVHEKHEGKTVWQGAVKCFAVEHPSGARRAFAWSFVTPEGKRRFTAVLGLPKRIRSDNGPPFATKALGGLSQLSVWWVRLGVLPERIEPGKPQQNGRHERFHKTLKEHTATPPCGSIEAQQRAFDRFRADYNDKRPHEALLQTPPAQHYEPSLRVMPGVLPELVYGDDHAVRWVNEGGMVSWKARTLYAGHVLAKQPLGFKHVDEGEHEIHFGPLLIGIALSTNGRVRIEPLS